MKQNFLFQFCSIQYIYNILNRNKIIARNSSSRYRTDPASIRLELKYKLQYYKD